MMCQTVSGAQAVTASTTCTTAANTACADPAATEDPSCGFKCPYTGACPTVTGGTCDTCPDANTCTAYTCTANFFDTDNDATTGCEATCPTVANGTCDTCSDATTCTAVTCTANFFDTDNDATTGCEATCPTVA